MTVLSTGLFQAEAQRMTLLATGARLFTLATTRQTMTMMSMFLPVRSARHQVRVGMHAAH